MGSAYCSKAWNWLFLVNVMIFRTVPNFEKIYRGKKNPELFIKSHTHNQNNTNPIFIYVPQQGELLRTDSRSQQHTDVLQHTL